MSESTENPFRHVVKVAAAGNFSALVPAFVADTENSLVLEYLQLIEQNQSEAYSFEYIATCLRLLSEMKEGISSRPLTIAAILCHVTGYKPGDKESRKRSCACALRFYPTEYIVPIIGRIKYGYLNRFTVATRKYDDRDIMSDVVLWMYGAEYEVFSKYWGLMIKDFMLEGYSAEKFKKFSRIRLRKLLKRSKNGGIYRTEHFGALFEGRAYENIVRLLEELGARV